MANARLLIEIITQGDVSGGFGKAADSMEQKSGKLAKAGAVAATGLLAIAGAALKCAKSASDTQQAFGGLDAVFGDSSGQMKDWANNAASTMGLSASAYAEGAAKIGSQLKNLGVPMDQVAGKTNDLIAVAADLAATYGGTTQEAVDALGAAMRGEADPAERYGLALNQTAVNAQMAADGTDKLTGKAKQQAKVQTLLAMVTEQSGGALGQFARESDSAAGSAQIAAAQWENAQSALGTALLPVLTQVATQFARFAGFVQEHATVFQILAVVIAAVAAAILVAAAAQWVMNLALLAFPGTWIVLAIVAVIAIIVLLWTKCEGFRNAVLAVWGAIKIAFAAIITAAQAVASFVVSAWAAIVATFNTVKAAIMSVALAVGTWLIAAWQTARVAIAAAISAIKTLIMSIVATVVFIATAIIAPWRWSFGLIKAIAQLAFVAIKLALQILVAAVKLAAAAIKLGFSVAWNAVKALATAVLKAIKSALSPLVSAVRSAASAIKSAFTAAWNAIKSAATAAANWIRSKFTALVGPIVAAVNRLKAAFSSAFSAIKNLASSAASYVKSKFSAIVGPIVGFANKIKSGFTSALNAIKSAASAAGGAISRAFSGVQGVINSIISAVNRLKSALSSIHVPKISLPKVGGASRSVTAMSGGGGLQLRSAQAARVPRLTAVPTTTGAGAVVINVNGALDPEAVARQIERVLSSAQRRRQGVTLMQRAAGSSAAA